MAFPSWNRPLGGLFPALALGGLLTGCLFESDNFVPEARFQTGLLDTLVSSKLTPARTVNLFQPLKDPSLKGKSPANPETLPGVNVKDHGTGEIIRYVLTRQRFGDWTSELEFRWNYFLLQVYFLFPQGVPDTAGLSSQTKTLYTEIHKTDAFTSYFDSAAAKSAMDRITNTTKPGALGIEVSLNDSEDSVVIRHVVPTSPAGRAGMAKGMIILAVDDSATVGDSAIERFSRFSGGDSGKASDLKLLTPDGIKTFHIVREPVAFPTVYVDSLDGIGYIAITGFMPVTVGSQTTFTEFKSALAATKRFKTTILDLRDNGGGSLDLTMRMCDEILPAGSVIVRQQQRQFSEDDHVPLVSMVNHLATSVGTAEKRKFVLLGNGHSASASEIFLVALREGANAPLVGVKTYGKGVGQSVRTTPGQGLALVTFLKFTSRNGVEYHKKGLEPDHVDTAGNHSQLLTAVRVAKGELSKTAKAAKRAASAEEAALLDRARALEWNRRQAVLPGIRDIETETLDPFLP